MGVTVGDVMAAQPRRILLGALERMVYSSANYWIVLLSDIVCAMAFLVVGLRQFIGPAALAVAAVIVGFLAWGFIEYAMHRWVLHGPPTMARRGHARHHADATALISTPFLVIMSGACAIWALLALAVPAGLAALLVFGMYSGYNYFALLHHLQHHREKDLARFGYWRRFEQLHRIHHDRHVVNFGITTTIWDRLLGTFEPSGLRPAGRSSASPSSAPRWWAAYQAPSSQLQRMRRRWTTSSGARSDRTG
jgi:sterol desaturase/sphingolipid hydroxylase (fatty acid hydroxylase superfamily)